MKKQALALILGTAVLATTSAFGMEDIEKNNKVIPEKHLEKETLNALTSQAKEGNIKAQDELMRRHYMESDFTFGPDTIDFFSWKDIQERCCENDYYAWFALVSGLKVPYIFEKVKERAEQGNPDAQHNLGWMYSNDNEVSGNSRENDKLAIKWYTEAANQGNAVAQNRLGRMYYDGRGIKGVSEENNKLAVEWFTKAANQGYASAQYNLGWLHARGKVVKKDSIEALRWYLKSKRSTAKNAIYSLLKCSDNLLKANGNRSFKDMLDEILREDSLQILLEVSEKEQETTIMGLTSLVYTHQIKKEFHNPDGANNALVIPQLYNLYTTIEAVEGEALELITSIKKKSTPGFLITTFWPTEEFKEAIASQCNPHFISIHPSYWEETYSFLRGSYKEWTLRIPLSIGEQNVLLAEKFMRYRDIIDKRFAEADDALKKVAQIYQKNYETALSDLKQLITLGVVDLPDSKERKFGSLCLQIKDTKKEIEQLKRERYRLSRVKYRIKSLVSDGASCRNREFLEDENYSFLK